MTNLHQKMRKGMTKDEALRQAQLNYLNSSGDRSPFYWAAFVVVGNAEAVYQGDFSWWWLLLLVLGIVVLAVIFKNTRYFSPTA